MALNAVAGMLQVTKHAWRHPARLAHALSLSAITQQSGLYHSSPQLSAAQPAAAEEAIAAAAKARISGGFEPYNQLAAESSPDGILTRGRDRFYARKMGQFAGLLLRNEPAGTICRLRALLQEISLESAIATANVAALVHDTPSIQSSNTANDSSDSNLMVFQTTPRHISARNVRDLTKPGDNPFDVIDIDLFKIPKPLLTPLMNQNATAAVEVLGTSGSVQHEVLTAIQAGKPAGPFAVVGYTAVSQFVQEITAARMELLQGSSSSSGDLMCRVDRAAADSTVEYQRAALAATIEGRTPPKILYVITVYPCPRWPETPRRDRVAAVAAAAAAVT